TDHRCPGADRRVGRPDHRPGPGADRRVGRHPAGTDRLGRAACEPVPRDGGPRPLPGRPGPAGHRPGDDAAGAVPGQDLTFPAQTYAWFSPVRRVTAAPAASLEPVSVPARGGPERTTRGSPER